MPLIHLRRLLNLPRIRILRIARPARRPIAARQILFRDEVRARRVTVGVYAQPVLVFGVLVRDRLVAGGGGEGHGAVLAHRVRMLGL